MAKKVYIGTSGWMYDHWGEGVFYPGDLPKSKWLDYYQKYFDTVEINNTFYHLPKEQTFKNWHKAASKKFIYAVKANRFITHIKKLNKAKDSVKLFMGRTKLLKENLGPILYQLPPRWKANPERLRDFTKHLSKKYVNVFEFRDTSWFNEEIYSILKKNKLNFCIYSMPGIDCPSVVTGLVVYIRMHGGSILYGSNYADSELKDLVKQIKGFLKKKLSVYVYFNNDAYGYAVRNALRLKELL
ncbi:hypothetical protein AMJ44_11595 [candidate division WOR-1 bacterium DG_54_3]|uniref:DUF72 domain-containing protein n=1 Tax=candidate division WOR-1 bacterium DG_54_3 TaxID=1703775 RepID=A0A0S7XRJ3_UNCSA|nr:MAG: hypothetical protein AMJ44_11595 [candidate division WOR-1 bacterium DG_54_3]